MARHRNDVDFQRPSEEAMSLGRGKGRSFEDASPKHRSLAVGDVIIPSEKSSVRLRVQGTWQEGSDLKYRATEMDEPHGTWIGYFTYKGKVQVVVLPWA